MAIEDLVKFTLKPLQRAISIVDKDGRPTIAFQRKDQETTKALIGAIQELATQVDSLVAAQEAADAANAAAAAATTAAAAANTAVASVTETSALTNSGIYPVNALTAIDAGTNATVQIAAHTRLYGDGTSVSVSAGSVTALSYSTVYYVYYDDPARAGGSVTYVATATASNAVQSGDRHSIGAIETPASGGSSSGVVVSPPGVISII